MDIFKKECKDEFIDATMWLTIQNSFDRLYDQIHDQMKILGENYEQKEQGEKKNFDKKCEKLMAGRFEKYDKVSKAYERFFDNDDIQISLDRKADKYMLLQLNDKKASNEDVQHTHFLLEKLNDRVKHVSVV